MQVVRSISFLAVALALFVPAQAQESGLFSNDTSIVRADSCNEASLEVPKTPISLSRLPIWIRSMVPAKAVVATQAVELFEPGSYYWVVEGYVHEPQSYETIASSVLIIPVSTQYEAGTPFSYEEFQLSLEESTSRLLRCRSDQVSCSVFADLKDSIEILGLEQSDLPHNTPARVSLQLMGTRPVFAFQHPGDEPASFDPFFAEMNSFEQFEVTCK